MSVSRSRNQDHSSKVLKQTRATSERRLLLSTAKHPLPISERQLLLSPLDLHYLGIPYSRAQLWKLVQRGEFPRPIKISRNRSAWVAEEVQAWVHARMSDRAA